MLFHELKYSGFGNPIGVENRCKEIIREMGLEPRRFCSESPSISSEFGGVEAEQTMGAKVDKTALKWYNYTYE